MNSGTPTLAAGFRDLTEEQLRTHLAWLKHLASLLVRDDARADDAVQETLSAAWRRSPSLDRDVRPWLARVLRNFVRTGLRVDSRRQTRERRSTSQPVEVAPSAEDLLSRHEEANLLSRLVSGLDEPQRSVVLLHLAEGVSLKEIARRRGVPEGTIRWQFKRAVDDLRLRANKYYAAQSRDWRLALVPLAHSAQSNSSAAGLVLKGAALMSLKSHVAAGLSVIVALFVAVGVAVRNCEKTRKPLADDRVAAGEASDELAPATPSGPREPPRAPSLINAGVDTDQELDKCVHDRQRLLVKDQPRYFNLMQPSSKNQALIGPIVERITSRFAPRPSYSLECRVSSCRFAALSGDQATARAWFEALNKDEELSRLRRGRDIEPGISRISSSESRAVKDSLTGTVVTIHEHYLSVPFLPASSSEESHPFDTIGDASPEAAPPSLAECHRQIAEMEQSLAKKFPGRVARQERTPVADAAVAAGGLELSPEERALVEAANERSEARARQVSRELLADLKGTGAPGAGDMSLEESLELFRIVNGEWNINRLGEGTVAELVRKHKKRLARHWKETLRSDLSAERSREILQALRDRKVAGLSLPRALIMGQNSKGEVFSVGWTDEDWRD